MTSLDSTIVYIAVPAMEKYFQTGIGYVTLVVVSYLIATTSTMIPSGNLATKFGKKRLYLLGFVVFTLSSLLIAISPNIIFAILFRGTEGIGAGILGTVGIPILLSIFPNEEHGRAIGINSIAWSIGALLGPVLGGVLVTFDWRYIFLMNLPVGIVATFLGYRRIPTDRGDKSIIINFKNILGFLLFIIPLTAGISFLNLSWIIAAGILSPIFAISQRGAALVPVSLLKKKSYPFLLTATSFQALSFFAVSYAMSVYLQSGAGISPFAAGTILAANPLASIIASPLGGYLFDKTQKGTLIMASGLLIQGSSVLMLSSLLGTNSLILLFIILFISGIGGTLFWTSSTVLAMDAGGEKNRSVASGTVFTLRNIALVIGLSSFPLFVAGTSGGVSALLTYQSGINILFPVRYYLASIGLLSYVSTIFVILYHIKIKSESS